MLRGPPRQERCCTFFNRRNRPLRDAEKVRQHIEDRCLVCLACLVFWLNETNQMNQIKQINKTNQINQMNQMNQTDQIDQPDQNRAERPMPTLVFLMELGSKFSLRLERCTPPNPSMESVRR